jgi:succinate-semialdehyde dehydrogenase/glutarate-semialdehyde dehydrogenase
MGPLARPDLAENVELQTNQLKNLGAKDIIPMKRDQNFLNASLYEISKDISNKFSEELFGPVDCLIKVLNENEAVDVANDTNFGLGASIWSSDVEKAQIIGKNIFSGSVFINSLVKSDASLAFGGIKNSGYGREIGSYGFHEFCNIKSYWIENPIL